MGFYRENLLLNDVLSSECCGFPVYESVVPSHATELNATAIKAFLGADRATLDQCSRMSVDADGVLVRALPTGGTLGLGPASVVGNFQVTFERACWAGRLASRLRQCMPCGLVNQWPTGICPPTLPLAAWQASFGQVAATVAGSPFSHAPPPIAHFVGATPYKIEYMQAFGHWDWSTDATARELRLLGHGSRREQKGCNLEKMNCVGQSGFNGLDIRRQVYFSQVLDHDRWSTAEERQRYLLLELGTWPAEFPALARLWLAAERLARQLGRELVVWNLPCSFPWSEGQRVWEQSAVGLRAAVVERTCTISLQPRPADAGGQGAVAARVLERIPERCCTAFFDLSDRRCDGLGEQMYACTDHIHRARFEQAVGGSAGAVDLAAALIDVADPHEHLPQSSVRIVHSRFADAAAVEAALDAVRARLGAAARPNRRYRVTESRSCAPADSAEGQALCARPIYPSP